MKKLLIASIAAAAFCGAPAVAADLPTKAPVYKAAPVPVPISNFYVSFGAGANWQTDPRISNADDDIDVPWKMKTGWAINGALGYALGNGVRVEVELSYRRNNVDTIFDTDDNVTRGGVGNINKFAVMFNAAYDFQNSSRFVPYLGGGLGPVRVNFRHAGQDTSEEPAPAFIDATYWRLGLQAFVGLDYLIDQNLRIGVRYNALHVGSVSGLNFFNDGAFQNGAAVGSMTDHTVMLIVRYNFGAGKEYAELRSRS